MADMLQSSAASSDKEKLKSSVDKIIEFAQRELKLTIHPMMTKKELIDDFVSIITSFCARIYGHRRSKRKTEKIIEELRNEE